jgi:hypothetical protein
LDHSDDTTENVDADPIASKTYGTVRAGQQKEVSGLEFVRGLVDGTLPLNMVAQTLGMT